MGCRCLVLALLAACGGSVPRYGRGVIIAGGGHADLSRQTGSLLVDLVRIDTTNPPGKERSAADAVAGFLRGAQIEAEVIAIDAHRACVYAEIRGSAPGRPIVLLSHLDAHPADRSTWRSDAGPFDGRIVEGSIHGRGVLDGKGLAAVHAAAMTILRSGVERDVIYIATADGARGEASGIEKVIEVHPEVTTASIAFAKGGYAYADLFDGMVHGVAVAEKGYAVLDVTAVGGRSPASVILADGLSRLFDRPERPRLTPPVADLFDHLADGASFPKSLFLRSRLLAGLALVSSLADDPATRPFVTDTIEVTRLASGRKGGRVASNRARALITAQLLEGRTPGAIRDEIRAGIGDPDVHVVIAGGAEASASRWSPAVLSVLADAVAKEGEVVSPSLGVESTDARVLRKAGVPVYGYFPIEVSRRDLESIRGANERIPIEALGRAADRMAAIVRSL
jgi:acetylornithine deacetylase/succinyl-diaminopimelate desuccinylase-like protein